MGGVKRRVLRGGGGREKKDEMDLELEEVGNVIRKLQVGKAMGYDGIPNEAWKYGKRK